MRVVATAGHVDHGKSTLVRALTGIEPDRWEEEHRRGMTIDLGYAWTTLPSGEQIAFVDVPGHERFLGNMLAGLGPAPAVVLVVAADEGWRRQSEEHLAAVDALGLDRGLIVVTRSDLADPAPALAEARARVSRSSLAGCEALAVSARTGAGLDELRSALDRLVAGLPTPRTSGRARLWVDRSFTIRGAGTVVTGTLGEGTLRPGDELALRGTDGRERRATVRGLQALEQPRGEVAAVARVAVNLRGVAADEITRGTALLTPDAWHVTSTLDVLVAVPGAGEAGESGESGGGSAEPGGPRELPSRMMLHVGTLAVEVHVRPLGSAPDGRLAVRLALPAELALAVGDRVILRDPGSRAVSGALVVDVDPPRLERRGAAARRAVEVGTSTGTPDLVREVARREALTVEKARRLGIPVEDDDGAGGGGDGNVAGTGGDVPVAGVTRRGRWLVDDAAWTRWARRLRAAVAARAEAEPLDPALSLEAARAAAGVPDRALVPELAAACGLESRDGRVALPGSVATLAPPVEAALRLIEQRLGERPFASPEQRELDAAGLGPREVAAAVRAGRLLRLPDDVLLLPSAPARAMRVLAALPQPFTTSDARVAMDSTRRTVIPLLEHLDGRGWTRRLDGSHREVRR